MIRLAVSQYNNDTFNTKPICFEVDFPLLCPDKTGLRIAVSLDSSYSNKESTQTSSTKHDTLFLPRETHPQLKAQPPSGASVRPSLYFQSQRGTQTKYASPLTLWQTHNLSFYSSSFFLFYVSVYKMYFGRDRVCEKKGGEEQHL